MSQFRIKNIDNFIPDEWVYKLNDGTNVVGDDIDARDPNELADAIFDTQTLLLKVSTLPSNTIIKPNSGLAERITILEAIAGNSTLQDIYSNGNIISVLPSKPLIFGTREEFKLDDSGNLSFKPVTMKIRGSGFQTLDLTNYSITTSLGDLLVGATSPGAKLTLRAEENLYLKDIFLTNPVTLSEPGNAALITTSQSIIGAINELKTSSFSTSLQDVYAQSTPPKLITNVTQGAVVIEDPNNSSTADALRVAGILNVTKKAKVGDLKVGINTTIADTTGYVSSDPIKTTNRVETPTVTSGSSELTLTDRRVSFPFSDNSVSGLLTNRKSVIGAINELKTDITTVGGASILFGAQHDATTGFHKIITTQAEAGQNAIKRITVKNQAGTDTFSVSGAGEVIAASATIGGLSVVSLLNDLLSHLTDDGTSHSALASHLLESNPHNTVKSIMGMSGNVNVNSLNSNIEVTSSGNAVNLKFINNINLQEVYNNLTGSKILTLGSNGLIFNNNSSAQVMKLDVENILLSKDLLLGSATYQVTGSGSVTITSQDELTLSSANEDIIIKTLDSSKKVIIQDVDFSEPGATEIPAILGNSIIGALKKIGEDFIVSLENNTEVDMVNPYPYFSDNQGVACPYIANLHPANEFLDTQVDFFWANKGSLYYPYQVVPAEEGGNFISSGRHLIQATTNPTVPSTFSVGKKLYPITLSYADLTLTDINLMTDNMKINIGSDIELTGKTGTAIISSGQFKIETTGNNNIKLDRTRNNIINLINSSDYIQTGARIKAGIWGIAPKAYITIDPSGVSTGVSFQINGSGILGVGSITFNASSAPAAINDFLASTVPEIVAESLAEAINKTTFRGISIGSNGHYCKATAKGSIVVIEYYMPGVSGELVTFSSGTGITTTPMIGGQCSLRIYDAVIENNTPYTASITGSGMNLSLTGGAFTPKEKTDVFFLTAEEALSSSRIVPHYVARELGTIEAYSENFISFRIKE